MITLEQYAGPWRTHKDFTLAVRDNVVNRLIPACNALEAMMIKDGICFRDNPATSCSISGQTYGGFRPQSCPIGAPKSGHKLGLAVDRYDPDGAIDRWCMINLNKLAAAGIYIESPKATNGWSHWQCYAPASGKRVFIP